jgi:hypothetical protein
VPCQDWAPEVLALPPAAGRPGHIEMHGEGLGVLAAIAEAAKH